MTTKGSEPVRSIRIGAQGMPGHRTFYLQTRLPGGDLVTLLLEKAQAIIIVDQIDRLLEQLTYDAPALTAIPDATADERLVLDSPDRVLFRAGRIALQYDPETTLVRFHVDELRGLGQGTPQFCLWWITRQQLYALGETARQVIRSGFAAQTE